MPLAPPVTTATLPLTFIIGPLGLWLVLRADVDRGILVGHSSPEFAIHLKADREGMKKYSPPRSTLNVWMPWMRRLTGFAGW